MCELPPKGRRRQIAEFRVLALPSQRKSVTRTQLRDCLRLKEQQTASRERRESRYARQIVDLWTDGGCAPTNPGPGGWAVVLCLGDTEIERAGCDPWTTNNRMELVAVINGLALIASPGQHVRVRLDSSYVYDPFVKGWLERWKRNGWRRTNGGDVLNRDLWERLIAEVARHGRVEWCKVSGHSGVPLNERAHQLVTAARERASADPEGGARACLRHSPGVLRIAQRDTVGWATSRTFDQF